MICTCSFALAAALAFEAHIQTLVEKMDNPKWQVREQAVKEAAALGRIAVPYLLKASKTHASQEVRKGCVRAVQLCRRSPGYLVLPDLYPQFKKYPQIKFLVTKYERLLREIDDEERKFRKQVSKGKVGDPHRVGAWLAAINERRDTTHKKLVAATNAMTKSLRETQAVMPSRNDTDVEFQRHATSLYVRDLLAVGMSREAVIDLMNDLVEIERRWYMENRPSKLPTELREPPVKK